MDEHVEMNKHTFSAVIPTWGWITKYEGSTKTIYHAGTIKPFKSDDSWENESQANYSIRVKGVTSLSNTSCLDE